MENIMLLISMIMLFLLVYSMIESEDDSKSFYVVGFHGKIADLATITSVKAAALLGEKSESDISIVEMAAASMNYLTRNPLTKQKCECRFCINPSNYPLAITEGEDTTAFGDTEVRMLRGFNFIREISGNTEGVDVEATIRERVLGYIRDDGMSYCRDCNTGDPEPLALNWTMSNTLSYLIENYRLTGDPQTLILARKLVAGMKLMADWDTQRAFYAGGLGGWKDGQWTMTGCKDSYPCIVEPIMEYYDVTGDSDALAFASAFTEGTLAGLQTNLKGNGIQPDGSFDGYNCHLHMRAVLGAVHLGVQTKNTRFIEWGHRVYDFLMSYGVEWGWFTEGPPPSGGDGGYGYATRSETCIVGDMAETALWLAKAGYTTRWDDIERFVRNYLRQSQFFVTPEYRAFYSELHTAEPEHVKDGLKQAAEFEGGFIARLSPNSLVYDDSSINMMGCCPPEAMRSLHVAWSNIVTRSDNSVFVNMAFDRDTSEAIVKAHTPDKGRLSVIVKQPADFYLRPPSWVTRSEVKAFRGNTEITAVWSGDYIKFSNSLDGEELSITYPVITFKQTVEVAGATYTYHWIGNTVVGVDPVAPVLPLFSLKTGR